MDNLELGLHDLIGDDFFAGKETGDPLFDGQGFIDFPENLGQAGPEDDFLELGLEAFGRGSPDPEEYEETLLRHEPGPFHRSFSMNDIQSLRNSNPPAWGRQQVSVRPSLQSVPEGNYLAPMAPMDETGHTGTHAQQQAIMNLPPLTSQQMNYSYMQYAGMPSQNTNGLCSSSDSAENGDVRSTIDGPSTGAPLGSLHRSRPSMGSLASQMDNQLQIEKMNSEGNVAGLVDPMAAGRDAAHDPMGMFPMPLPSLSSQGPTSQPIVQKSSGPGKQILPGGFMGGFKPGMMPPPGGPPSVGAAPPMPSSPMDLASSSQQHSDMHAQQQHPRQPARSVPPSRGGMPHMPKPQPSGMPIRKSQSALELVSWRGSSSDLAAMWGDPAAGAIEQLQNMKGIRAGRLTPEERLQKILRYRQKRQERNFNRTIKYHCRKSLADTRPRVRGRFARNDDVGIVLPHETKKAQREREMAQAQQGPQPMEQHQPGGMLAPASGGMHPGGMLPPTNGGMRTRTDGGMLAPTNGGMLAPTNGGMLAPTNGGMPHPQNCGMHHLPNGGMPHPPDGGMPRSSQTWTCAAGIPESDLL